MLLQTLTVYQVAKFETFWAHSRPWQLRLYGVLCLDYAYLAYYCSIAKVDFFLHYFYERADTKIILEWLALLTNNLEEAGIEPKTSSSWPIADTHKTTTTGRE